MEKIKQPKESKEKIRKAQVWDSMEKYEASYYLLINLLFILFLGLKLGSVIDWNWFLVFIPMFVKVMIIWSVLHREEKNILSMADEKSEGDRKFEESLEEELKKLMDENENDD